MILALAFLILTGITVAAVEVILWQSADISVSIVSKPSGGDSCPVRISVLNTAADTLLFYEGDALSAKVEYYSGEKWEDFCDITYTDGNLKAISQQYCGVFAELEPGDVWSITIPEAEAREMKAGRYRIRMTYITENDYRGYIDASFGLTSAGADAASAGNAGTADSTAALFAAAARSIADSVRRDTGKPAYGIPAFESCKVYVKEFSFTEPKDFRESIDFDETAISKSNSEHNGK